MLHEKDKQSLFWVAWGPKDAGKHRAGVERKKYLQAELKKHVTVHLFKQVRVDCGKD